MNFIKWIAIIYALTCDTNAKIIPLPEITSREKACTNPPVTDPKCRYTTPDPNKWINIGTTRTYDPPSLMRYKIQPSIVTSEPSPTGFVIVSDKLECSPGMVSCEIQVTNESSFTSTTSWDIIGSMSIELWKIFTASVSSSYSQSYSKTSSSAVSYTCTFPGNSSGYLAIWPQTGLITGLIHMCEVSPVDDCTWGNGAQYCEVMARVIEVNPDDGSAVGTRRCVIANNEAELQKQLEKGENLNWAGPEVEKFASLAQIHVKEHVRVEMVK